MKLIRFIILTISLVLVLEAREQVNMKFSDLDINDFIALVSRINNKNILVDKKIVGTINMVSSSPVYKDELMNILISVLESKGFTIVENGSFLQIVMSAEASQYNIKVMDKGKKLSGSIMLTQAIKIEGNNVDIVAAKVRHLISKTAKLITLKEGNIMLITDYPDNIETLKRIVKDLASDSKMLVKIFTIVNADAKKVQSRLLDVSKSLFDETIPSEQVKIILDDHINGIVVVANEKNISKLETLIKKLDIKSNATKKVHIFELKNSDATSVLASLTEIISKQVFSDPSLKPNVSVSEEINAIIAIGEPIIIDGIKTIIDELDKEKYQVYVEARIIEINKKNTEDLGVKYGFDGAKLTSSGLYSFSSNFGLKSPIQGVVGAGVASIPLAVGDKAFALGAAIDFLQTNGAAESISNPSILCVNNKESSIYVGKTISISTGSVTSSTSAIPGVTNSFTREDVGLTLKIKPRVSSSDKVTLDVETILENIIDDGSNNQTGQPVTSKQEVKTQAILRHGESIIIGGLVKSYDIESTNKIPLLGDIPLIGSWLFSSTSIVNEEDNLIVILTPYVIDKSEKLSQLQQDLGKLTQLQSEYNEKVFKQIEEKGMKAVREEADSLKVKDTKEKEEI